MSVVLDPGTVLGFNRPLTNHVKRTLAIKNPNTQPVAFKVKTTAPKLYCVRPNSGRVDPGESVEVQVMLQAMKEEPPLAAKCKDKFLIQSTLITPEKETLPLQDIWSGESSDDIHSQKIRVAYLPPEGQTVPEEDEGHSQQAIDPAFGRPSVWEHFNTTAQHPENGHGPIPDFSPDNSHDLGRSDADIHVDAPSTPPPPEPAPALIAVQREEPPVVPSPPEERPAVINVNVHSPSPAAPPPAPPVSVPAPAPIVMDPNPELLAKLEDANSEIKRLRDLISSMPAPSTVPPTSVVSGTTTDFRRRTRALSDDGSSVSPETDVSSYVDEGQVQTEGVPLQVVIIVALGVFITTYLFF
ncbi:PapD-like protein [Irpex rosettiformis]|uniref:PapD-like protein n=1 Tax=Irpex rosettiformis TaxID=378272 RepID=A0ACB8U0F3_9APHY|nr:PapD-like protein [Irpex rosettiformis]